MKKFLTLAVLASVFLYFSPVANAGVIRGHHKHHRHHHVSHRHHHRHHKAA